MQTSTCTSRVYIIDSSDGLACRDAAQQLAEQLQGVYLLDKKASETVRAGVLEALGLLVEVAPQVRIHISV